MGISLLRAVTVAAFGFSLLEPVLAISPAFNYGTDKVRGVNLGGWLVLEPWITPSLFENTGISTIVDEWTFCEYQDTDIARETLTKHWSTWITESDFADIASAGLNHVRIPIGYWAFNVTEHEPYIQGQVDYLRKALRWAAAHGLQVIVDLHGVPGSQNGFDNSGRRMSYPGWHSDHSNIVRSNDILYEMARLFGGNASIIEPLNEPAGFCGDDVLQVVKQYWEDSYDAIRSIPGTNAVVLIHDAFQDLSYWKDFMRREDNYDGVAMDTHIYQMFSSEEVARSDDEHIAAACQEGPSLSSFHLWTIVGEWTAAPTDCAKYLNGKLNYVTGRGVGARYDGTYPNSTWVGDCGCKTGSASSFSQEYKDFLRKYWEAQVITYQNWIHWTWKAESADDWSYQAGLAGGWIPHDPTNMLYPSICG
ncbi:glycoside hydrolase family 5 protein [Armillaria solidipes]|uniref:Glycoside hydrolase family 5 protein n=1 Tax=Armillaria solidipes TaxID=1076256 RepID=A0A2H3C9M7_9AGAR|nr:glycoside hydrolase family 5 protein [Armillaria solidipes]